MGTLGKLFAVTVIAPAFLAYKVCEAAVKGIALGLRSGKKQSIHGDAAFMSEREMRKFSKPDGLMPGVTPKGRRVRLGNEASVLMFGIRGAGKTQTANANIKALKDVRVKPDLIVADDHGDIELACREDLLAMGYEVIRIDLSDPLNSHKYDPLNYLRPFAPFEYEREVERLAMLLIPDSGKENEVGQHFNDNARAVLQASIIYEMEKSIRTVSSISKLLLTDKKARTAVFNKMRTHRNLLVQAGVEAFEAAGDRERGSMETTLSRKLKPWLSAALQHITTGDGLDFDEMFMDPKSHAVFIRTGGAEKEHSGAFIRLMMGVAIYTVKRLWNVTKRPLPKGLLLIVDEPETVGNCSAFEVALKELRKVGVNLFICFQSLGALKRTYSDPTAILNNCAWIICGGGNDLALYKEASQLAGNRTVMSRTFSKGEHKSESEHEAGVPLVRPDELQALPRDEVVVIGQGILAKLKKPYRISKGVIRYL